MEGSSLENTKRGGEVAPSIASAVLLMNEPSDSWAKVPGSRSPEEVS